MTEFADGDVIKSKLGSHFTRRNGVWESPAGASVSDATARYLLTLTVPDGRVDNKHVKRIRALYTYYPAED